MSIRKLLRERRGNLLRAKESRRMRRFITVYVIKRQPENRVENNRIEEFLFVIVHTGARNGERLRGTAYRRKNRRHSIARTLGNNKISNSWVNGQERGDETNYERRNAQRMTSASCGSRGWCGDGTLQAALDWKPRGKRLLWEKTTSGIWENESTEKRFSDENTLREC